MASGMRATTVLMWPTSTNWMAIKKDGRDLLASFRGFEWVNVQLGVDFMLGRSWRLGPFVQARVGQYDTGSLGVVTPQGAEPSGTSDLPSKSAHAWIDVGVRLGFLL